MTIQKCFVFFEYSLLFWCCKIGKKNVTWILSVFDVWKTENWKFFLDSRFGNSMSINVSRFLFLSWKHMAFCKTQNVTSDTLIIEEFREAPCLCDSSSVLFAISARPSNKYRKYTSCMLRAWFNSAHARTQGCLQKGRVVSLPYKALRLAHVVDLAAKSQFAESCSQNWCRRCFKIAVPIMAQKGKLWFWWQFLNNYIWSNFSDFTTSTQKVHKEEKLPYFRKIQAGEVLKFCKIFMNTKHFKRRSHIQWSEWFLRAFFQKSHKACGNSSEIVSDLLLQTFPVFWGFDWFPILIWPESLHLMPHVVHHANQLADGEANLVHAGIRPLKCNEASKPDVACLQAAVCFWHEEIFEDQTCEITNFCSHLSTAQRVALLHPSVTILHCGTLCARLRLNKGISKDSVHSCSTTSTRMQDSHLKIKEKNRSLG